MAENGNIPTYHAFPMPRKKGWQCIQNLLGHSQTRPRDNQENVSTNHIAFYPEPLQLLQCANPDPPNVPRSPPSAANASFINQTIRIVFQDCKNTPERVPTSSETCHAVNGSNWLDDIEILAMPSNDKIPVETCVQDIRFMTEPDPDDEELMEDSPENADSDSCCTSSSEESDSDPGDRPVPLNHSFALRKPPNELDTSKALQDLSAVLRPPRKTGRGYRDVAVEPLCTRMIRSSENVPHHLYISPNDPPTLVFAWSELECSVIANCNCAWQGTVVCSSTACLGYHICQDSIATCQQMWYIKQDSGEA